MSRYSFAMISSSRYSFYRFTLFRSNCPLTPAVGVALRFRGLPSFVQSDWIKSDAVKEHRFEFVRDHKWLLC